MKKIFSVATILFLVLSSFLISFTVKSDEEENYDLLIITPNYFKKELLPLASHKEKYEISTKIVTLEEIDESIYFEKLGRDNAEEIKYFIKNAYDNWLVKYVLLVGGRKSSIFEEKWWLPVRYSHLIDRWTSMPKYREDKFISELYFADIYNSNGTFSTWDSDNDGIYGEWKDNKSAQDILDLYPEVFLGRLPCRNKVEVKNIVNKIINYESKPADSSWFNTFLSVAGDTYTYDDDIEGEIESQMAIDQMPGFDAIKLWTSTGELNGPFDVIKNINKGCGFIFFNCHGAPSMLGVHKPMDKKWIHALLNIHMPFLINKEKLPVCVCTGCHCSMFNVSVFNTYQNGKFPCYETINWQVLRIRNGGTIATIGNTGLSLIAEDKLNPSKGGGTSELCIRFFTEYGLNNTDIIGKTWGKAIESYLDDHPINWCENSYNDSSIDAKVVEQWVLFGDPSLKIGGYS